MKFGIDFGTTRILVAYVDRGNYPLVLFERPEGVFDWFPALIAIREHEWRFGWDAWVAQAEPGWTIIRSLKRSFEDAGPETRLVSEGIEYHLSELVYGLVTALRLTLQARFGDAEPLEAMLGVPANSHSNQRFLTVEAFRRAGFSILGLLNEPTAASIEYGYRQKATGRTLVYDLGGGTFHASLVEIDAETHTVVASEGVSTLGGDDFDFVLEELAVESGALASLQLSELFRLNEECRSQKEALHANSAKIVVDLDVVREGMGQVTIAVQDFYRRCRHLLEPSLKITRRLAAEGPLEALYMTGGGSELPLVSQVLREEFGRKVKLNIPGRQPQSDSPFRLTQPRYKVRELLTRNFGVWREGYAGHLMVFDLIFPRGTRLPGAGEPPLSVNRLYSPVHNVGHVSYLEASDIDENDEPSGDITAWDEILFPFDPALSGSNLLEGLRVARSVGAIPQEIEEYYACDAAGLVTVTIQNLTSQYGREYRLGRWSGKTAMVTPLARRRAQIDLPFD